MNELCVTGTGFLSLVALGGLLCRIGSVSLATHKPRVVLMLLAFMLATLWSLFSAISGTAWLFELAQSTIACLWLAFTWDQWKDVAPKDACRVEPVSPVKHLLLGPTGAFILSAFILVNLEPIRVVVDAQVYQAYDTIFPVASMKGKLVERNKDYVLLSIKGRKNRECTFLTLQAYAYDKEGENDDAYLLRVDKAAEAPRNRPVGVVFDLGLWQIWPLHEDSVGVQVLAKHECSNRMVTTSIANIRLSDSPSTVAGYEIQSGHSVSRSSISEAKDRVNTSASSKGD